MSVILNDGHCIICGRTSHSSDASRCMFNDCPSNQEPLHTFISLVYENIGNYNPTLEPQLPSDGMEALKELMSIPNIMDLKHPNLIVLFGRIERALQSHPPLPSGVEKAITDLQENRLIYGFESSGERTDVNSWFSTLKQALQSQQSEITVLKLSEQSLLKRIKELEEEMKQCFSRTTLEMNKRIKELEKEVEITKKYAKSIEEREDAIREIVKYQKNTLQNIMKRDGEEYVTTEYAIIMLSKIIQELDK